MRFRFYLESVHYQKARLHDPRHAYPTNQIASDFWYYITGRNTHRCDLTYEPVEKPEGIVVDPWAMRLRPGLFDQLLGSDYADKTELSFSFWRDWSPWFFSEEFRARLEQYPEDYTSIANPFANTVSASSGGA
jgi:hypothetical protein